MRKFGKCLLALILCCGLSVTLAPTATAAAAENCPGSCAHAAAIGTTHYDTLEEALSAAADGNTVTVLKDITDAGVMTVGSAITLDLGGKTVSGVIDPSKALLCATKDLTVTNGTLSSEGGVCLEAKDCSVTIEKTVTLRSPMVATGANGTVTVNFHGTLTSNDFGISTSCKNNANCILNIGSSAVITANSSAVSMLGKGQLNITGGTVTAKENAVILHIADEQTMNASITGGKFQVTNGETVAITKGTNATAPAGFVTGGTYNKVPTACLASNCRTRDNGDGTYTVIAQNAITYVAGGGSGTMTAVKADTGSAFTLPACTMTAPAGKHFCGWEINGTTYGAGASITVTSDLTLKALWANHTGGSATCLSRAVCTVCGVAYGDYGIHNLASYGASAATCAEAGSVAHNRCTTCGSCFVNGVSVSADTLTIPALKHEWKQLPGKAATCTEDGLQAHEKCAHCDALQLKGKTVTQEALVIPATGHKLKNVPAAEATCTQAGTVAHERCQHCDQAFVNGKAVDPKTLTTQTLSHLLSDWESDSATHWKSCTGCGEIFRQHSHKDDNRDGSCDECGYTLAASEDSASVEEDTVSFPYLIPIIAAVVIAAGGVVLAVKKKSA